MLGAIVFVLAFVILAAGAFGYWDSQVGARAALRQALERGQLTAEDYARGLAALQSAA